MNIKIYISAILLFFTFLMNGFSQDTEFAPIPNYIPPSPNAAALGKYGDIPIGYYTGTPNINIPLGSVTAKRLSLPMSLSYHAGGIKVDEIASQVGLGWSLNAGGVVTRTVRGLPDDGVNGYQSLCENHNVCVNADLSIIENDAQLLDDISRGLLDAQPDMFSFNFAGYSGKFVIDLAGDVQVIPKQNLKIEPNIGFGINSFIITTSDGVIYEFSDTESTTITFTECNPQVGDPLPNFPHRSSWYLSKISDPNGDEINLAYTNYGDINYASSISESKYIPVWSGGGDLNGVSCSSIPNNGQIQSCINHLGNEGIRLTNIYSDFMNAKFNYSYERDDLDGGVRLESIEYFGAIDEELKTYNFTYDYFDAGGNAPANLRKRLKLKSVYENKNNLTIPPHFFEYLDETSDPDYNLPVRLSTEQDHWGFYNRNTSGTLLPAIDHVNLVDLGDRSPDPKRSKAGLLNRITYPTGGSTTFDFELHKAGAFIADWNEVCEIHEDPKSVMVEACNVTTNCSNGPICPPSEDYTCVNLNDQVSFTVTNQTIAKFTWRAFNYGLLSQEPPSEECIATDMGVIFNLAYTDPQGNVSNIDNIGSPSYQNTSLYIELGQGDYVLSVNAPANCDYAKMTVDWTNYEEICQSYLNGVNGRSIGGVRIKNISTDPIDGPIMEKSYTYDKSEIGVTNDNDYIYSSGVLVSTPTYYGEFYIAADGCSPPVCPVGRLQSSSITSIGYAQGSHIAYTNVKETLSNSEAVNEYKYSFIRDFTEVSPPFGPGTSNDWQRGHLIEHNMYKGEILMKKIENKYDFRDDLTLDNNAEINGMTVSSHIVGCQGVSPDNFYINNYAEKSYWMYLASSTETTYDQDGNNPIIVTTTNTFEPDYLNMISQTVAEENGTVGITTDYKFANEMLNGNAEGCSVSTLNEMKSRHMVGIPIQVNKSGSNTSGSRTCFILYNDMIVPWKIFAIEGTSGWDLQATLYYDDSDEYPDRMRRNNFVFDEEYTWIDGQLMSKTYQSWNQSWTYDSNSRLLKTSSNLDGTSSSYDYDDFQRLNTINTFGTNQSLKSTSTIQYIYGPENKIITSKMYSDGSDSQFSERIFDGLGRSRFDKRIGYSPDGSDVTVQSITYDDFGRKAASFTLGQGTEEYSYENSPMNRLKKIVFPDYSTVLTDYFNNSENEVNGYPASSLFKTVTTDENGNVTSSFTDVLGRNRVSRRHMESNESADTYTNYDEFGNVSSIITPLDKNYLYQYDSKNRLFKKTIPGGGIYEYEYYQNDLLFKTTLPNGHIMYNYYDDYDRLVTVSLDGTIGSTNNIIENVYDVNFGNSESAYFGKLASQNVRVLNTDDWLETKNEYDNFGRVTVQSGDNYVSGEDIITTIFDNADNPLSVNRAHTSAYVDVLDINFSNSFDHSFRLIQTDHQVNNNPMTTIGKLFYDGEDRMIAKQLYGNDPSSSLLQQIDYGYNVRGWLTNINEVGETEFEDETTFVCDPDEPVDCTKCDYSAAVTFGEVTQIIGIYADGGQLVDLPNYPYQLQEMNQLESDIENWLMDNNIQYQGVYITVEGSTAYIFIAQSAVAFNQIDLFFGNDVNFNQENCTGSSFDDPSEDVCAICLKAGFKCEACPYWNVQDECKTCEELNLPNCKSCEFEADVCDQCTNLGYTDCTTCPLTLDAIKPISIKIEYNHSDLLSSKATLIKVTEKSKYLGHNASSFDIVENKKTAVVGDNALSSNPMTHYMEIDLSDQWINVNSIGSTINTLQNLVIDELTQAGINSSSTQMDFMDAVEKTISNNWNVVKSAITDSEAPSGNPDLFSMEISYDGGDPMVESPAQFNGNISGLTWKVVGRAVQNYSFWYDPLDRLTEGKYKEDIGSEYTTDNKYGVQMDYDKEGNIQWLKRRGVSEICAGPTNPLSYAFDQIDDLRYTYNNTNQLESIKEDSNKDHGYKGEGGNYEYDNAGNLIADHNKKITISYNYLNLPETIIFYESGESISFVYNALGTKLQKLVNGTIKKEYAGGVEYTEGELEAIYHAEGRVAFEGKNTRYEYYLKDHLGNTRVVFSDLNKDGYLQPFNEDGGVVVGGEDSPGTYTEILQENHFYPFGMKMEGPWDGLVTSPNNNYLFNGKELNDDFGLDWMDYGARWYDASIGRWAQVDPLAEMYAPLSPYHYAGNNPIINVDPTGMAFFKAKALGSHWTDNIGGSASDNADTDHPNGGGNSQIFTGDKAKEKLNEIKGEYGKIGEVDQSVPKINVKTEKNLIIELMRRSKKEELENSQNADIKNFIENNGYVNNKSMGGGFYYKNHKLDGYTYQVQIVSLGPANLPKDKETEINTRRDTNISRVGVTGNITNYTVGGVGHGEMGFIVVGGSNGQLLIKVTVSKRKENIDAYNHLKSVFRKL